MSKVTDAIREDGRMWDDWKYGNCIFIDAPTGSGKTSFILETLLRAYAPENKRILYLVNRRVLKEQMEKNLLNVDAELAELIHVELYQTIEKIIYSTENNKKEPLTFEFNHSLLKRFEDFGCVVCDECHYFLADSNYNTNTGLSFRFVQEMFINKIRIFMSATIDDIRDYVMKDNIRREMGRTYHYSLSPKYHSETDEGEITYTVSLEDHYDYLDIGVIHRKEDILDIIDKEKGKWLIFVDNISFGKSLEKDIVKLIEKAEINKNKVTMVYSDYRKMEESANEVKRITDEEAQSSDILISTSVLDNGINIKDIELRNMIIIADTKVEFIQMLGRKRKDKMPLKLYIYKYDKNHFTIRQRQNRNKQTIAREYMKKIKEPMNDLLDAHLSPQMAVYRDRFGLEEDIEWERYNDLEKKVIDKQHIKIMRDIACNHISHEDVNSVCNVYAGKYYLNLLAKENVDNLNCYYNEIIKKFDEEGEDAFLKEQLRWLGKTEDEISEIISLSKENRIEVSKNAVITVLESIVDKGMPKEEMLNLKKEIADDLKVLVGSVDGSVEDKKKTEENIKKNDRVISVQNMEFLHDYCNIPFLLIKKDSVYTFKKSE